MALRRRWWDGLGQAAETHALQVAAADPIEHFIQLLGSSIGSGDAHVAAPDGNAPEEPPAWGWREREFGTGENVRTEWFPHGVRVGWVDGDDLYLDLNSALKAAQAAAGAGGEGVVLGAKTLAKRLHKRGFLVSVEQAPGRLKVRRTLEGRVRRVLHMHASSLLGGSTHSSGSDKSDQPDREVDSGARDAWESGGLL